MTFISCLALWELKRVIWEMFILKKKTPTYTIVIAFPSGLPSGMASISHNLSFDFKAQATFAVIKGHQMFLKPLMQMLWYKVLESPSRHFRKLEHIRSFWSQILTHLKSFFFFSPCPTKTFNFIRLYDVHRACENHLIIILHRGFADAIGYTHSRRNLQ